MATEKFFVFNEAGTLKRLKGRIVRFLDNEDPTGSDKDAIRTSLEVSPDAAGLVQADVGTAPNEIPVNGMLGDLAYQSADSVSVDDLEVTGKLDIDSSGNVSIGAGDVANNGSLHVYRSSATADLNLQSAGGSGRSYALQSKADGNLVIRDNNAAADRCTIDSSGRVGIGTSSPTGKLEVAVAPTPSSTTVNETADFADSAIISHLGSSANGDRIPLVFNVGNSGANGISAAIVGEREASGWNSALSFWTNNVTSGSEGTDAIQEAIRITSDKNLVMTGGGGIDFGSTTTGSGTVATNGGLLADYEFGDFTMTAGGTWTVTPTATSGKYVKVGNLVTCYVVFTGSPTKASSTSGWLQGLPFATNVYAGLGSVSDTSVADRGNCYAGNTDRLWLTGTSFGATNYATVSYRHD